MQKVPIMVGNEEDMANCPTCGMVVRIVRNNGVYSDHYEHVIDGDGLNQILPALDEQTSKKLKKLRKGKKTVAMVGMAPTSCSLAPFDDPDVEIWGLNEAHAFDNWMKRWDRWFQIHQTESWKRYIAKRDVRGHFDWLRQEHYAEEEAPPQRLNWWSRVLQRLRIKEHRHTLHQREVNLKPIYMQYWHPEVPCSVSYPLHEVSEKVFKNFRRGEDKIKYFTSTFAYMCGIAILEEFERVEVYGFEMSGDIEYLEQKACAEFFIGQMMGRGMEVYTPPGNQIMLSMLYGGNEQGAGW